MGIDGYSFGCLVLVYVSSLAIFVINTSGKARLAKFYNKKDEEGKDLTEHHQQAIITDVFQQVSRRALHLCNFVEYAGNIEGFSFSFFFFGVF